MATRRKNASVRDVYKINRMYGKSAGQSAAGATRYATASTQGKMRNVGRSTSRNVNAAGKWAAKNPYAAIAAGTLAVSVAGYTTRTAENRGKNKRQKSRERVAQQKASAKTRAANHPTNKTSNPNASRRGRKGHPVRGAGGKFAGWSS